jgi:hypothetical protein
MHPREFTQAHAFCICRERLNIGLSQKIKLPPVNIRRRLMLCGNGYEPDNLLQHQYRPWAEGCAFRLDQNAIASEGTDRFARTDRQQTAPCIDVEEAGTDGRVTFD